MLTCPLPRGPARIGQTRVHLHERCFLVQGGRQPPNGEKSNILMGKTETTRRHLESLYTKALRQYLAGGGERAVRVAYQAGRRALANGLGVVDIAAVHHSALGRVLNGACAQDEMQARLNAAKRFFVESLSAHEMVHRGYRDAVARLRLLNETLENEAQRLAHAVHDEAGHLLLAVHLAMAKISRDLSPAQRVRIQEVTKLLHQAEKQLRQLSHELRPTMLNDLGLVPAVQFLADGVSKRFNLPVLVKAPLKGRLPPGVETALYRIIQEALTNVTKHAQAGRVRILLRGNRRRICCSIRDDGVGFDARALFSGRRQTGLGLIGIRERLNAIGGTLQVTSKPGKGTLLLVTVPMEGSHSKKGPKAAQQNPVAFYRSLRA